VLATLASALSVDATAAGFSLARGCTTPHAQARMLGSMAGFQCIQSHIVGPKLRAALTPAFPLSTGAQPR
jgi:putative Mn2+ efflux pump MntP